MAQQKNELIYKVGADTSDFQKNIDGAKSALRDFNSTSTKTITVSISHRIESKNNFVIII